MRNIWPRRSSRSKKSATEVAQALQRPLAAHMLMIAARGSDKEDQTAA